jgi:hypothetical protein
MALGARKLMRLGYRLFSVTLIVKLDRWAFCSCTSQVVYFDGCGAFGVDQNTRPA